MGEIAANGTALNVLNPILIHLGIQVVTIGVEILLIKGIILVRKVLEFDKI